MVKKYSIQAVVPVVSSVLCCFLLNEPAKAASLKFTSLQASPGFIEGNPVFNENQIFFATELASINTDEGRDAKFITDVLEPVLKKNTADAIKAGAPTLVAAFSKNGGTKETTLSFQVASEDSNTKIYGIEANFFGTFLVEADCLFVCVGRGTASFSASNFLGTAQPQIQPSRKESTNNNDVIAIPFVETVSILLPTPVSSAVFSSNPKLTVANEGLTDTFSASVLQSFSANIITEPLAATFFTNELDWQKAIFASNQNIREFIFSSANVNLANEVSSPPNNNTAVGKIKTSGEGSTLTFDTSKTNLPLNFSMTALQKDADLVFNDTEDGSCGKGFGCNFDLSIGDIGNDENDNFLIEFNSSITRIDSEHVQTNRLFGFAFDLVDNNSNTDESYRVYDGSGNLIGNLPQPGIPIPTSGNNSSRFLGVVTNRPIGSSLFLEDSGGDDIAVRLFRFGFDTEVVSAPTRGRSTSQDVPEPTTLLGASLALGGGGLFKRKLSKKRAKV